MNFKSFVRVRGISYVFVTAALCVFLSSFQSASAQKLDSMERQRASDMLKTIKGSLKDNYYDPGFHGLDIDARFKAADEKLKQAGSLGQALGIIAQVLMDLDDSHAFFIPPARPERVEYGWQMQMIGDGCYVVAVKPGSDAEKKGLKVGDLVRSVEGFKPNRKNLWKMNYYYGALSPRPGLQVVAQSPGAEPRQLDIAAKVNHGKRILTFEQDYNELVREAANSGRLNRHRFYKLGNVIAWKMPNFEFEPTQADTTMSDTVGNRALILDLRGNGGGYVDTLERLAGNFFDHDLKIADLKGRKEMKPQLAKTHGKATFSGKLIVLIDSNSGSASEIFARLIQLEKRGIVIGDRSAGAVMQARAYFYEVGAVNAVGYGVSITNADVIMSDGKSVENVGVIPDELMLPTAEDMAAGRDPVLARAFELAGIKLDSTKAGELFPIEWKKM